VSKHVYDIEISERVSKDLLKEFQDKLKENKPGKKKKKKKKKVSKSEGIGHCDGYKYDVYRGMVEQFLY
jgi:hypothetical protein